MRDHNVCQIVGRRLRRRRHNLDLTQAQVARRCGISFQQLQKYEAGQVDLPIGRLVMLAHALGLTLLDLVQGLTPDTRSEMFRPHPGPAHGATGLEP